MRTKIDQRTLEQHLRSLRSRIEESRGISKLFWEFLIPEDTENMPLFEKQMKDLLEVEDFGVMLSTKMDTAVTMLSSHFYRALFSQESAVARVTSGDSSQPTTPYKSPERSTWPLAKVLPVAKKAHEVFFRAEAVEQLNSPPEVAEFFSLIYTSMEGAPAQN